LGLTHPAVEVVGAQAPLSAIPFQLTPQPCKGELVFDANHTLEPSVGFAVGWVTAISLHGRGCGPAGPSPRRRDWLPRSTYHSDHHEPHPVGGPPCKAKVRNDWTAVAPADSLLPRQHPGRRSPRVRDPHLSVSLGGGADTGPLTDQPGTNALWPPLSYVFARLPALPLSSPMPSGVALWGPAIWATAGQGRWITV